MREAEDELVDDAVDCDGAADELQRCVGGVVEDEVVPVEGRQWAASHATCELSCSQLPYEATQGPEYGLTVGTWLTYGSCTIVLIVCSTERSANS